MKTLIATTILIAASAQASANGFYQSVVTANVASQPEIQINAPSTFVTPLYQQVTASKANFAEESGIVSQTTYTPLYEAVSGNPQANQNNTYSVVVGDAEGNS